jgi:predicted nucleic acid-binding protein
MAHLITCNEKPAFPYETTVYWKRMLSMLLLTSVSIGIFDRLKEHLANATINDPKGQEALLFALADVAMAIDRTVTKEEAEKTVARRVVDLIERVDIADAAMKEELKEIYQDVLKTRAAIAKIVEDAKAEMLTEMEYSKDRIIGIAMQMVEQSKEAQATWSHNAYDIIQDFFRSLKGGPSGMAGAFFLLFQLFLILGVFYFRKLTGLYRMFL